MYELILDALIDSLKIIPLLLVIYIIIELVEYKLGNKIRENVQKAGVAGPVLGAVAGVLPQCGFSVVTTALYTQRLVTIGTLLAVYLSTSDEAIPILLAQPDKAGIVVPLLLSKVVIAIVAGYIIDFIYRKTNRETLKHIKKYALHQDDTSHHHETVKDDLACCGHSTCSTARTFSFKELFIHPLIHTLKIFVYILLTSLAINLIIFWVGHDALVALFANHVFWQPFLAALIGLIPNCAASVTITELYLSGIITYGSVIAGLCASGGLGLLILFKEEEHKKNAYRIIALLYGISVVAGLTFQYLF
jgi:hypothetical protein